MCNSWHTDRIRDSLIQYNRIANYKAKNFCPQPRRGTTVRKPHLKRGNEVTEWETCPLDPLTVGSIAKQARCLLSQSSTFERRQKSLSNSRISSRFSSWPWIILLQHRMSGKPIVSHLKVLLDSNNLKILTYIGQKQHTFYWLFALNGE